jgi:hypothetical protein
MVCDECQSINNLFRRRIKNMKASFLNIIGAGAGIVLASAALVSGQPILYQSTTVDTGTSMNFPNGATIGQQIWLGTTTPAYLTNFSFEYYSPNATFAGNVKMEVALYANNAPAGPSGYKAPGSVIYDSGLIPLLTPQFITGMNVATFDITYSDLLNGIGTGASPMPADLYLPTNFTFTVTFSGLGTGDSVGLEEFGYPTVGGNYGDYWYFSGSWQLLTNGTPTTFGAQFMGATPEPTVVAVGVLGATMIAGFIRRRRK